MDQASVSLLPYWCQQTLTTNARPYRTHDTHGAFFAVGRQLYLQSVIGPQHFTVPSELSRGVGRSVSYAFAQPEVPSVS